MILRRVIKHVRNQEWTSIAIDFLIVVLGVFVGLQVSNWNETRLQNIAAADFNTRLLTDLGREAMTYDAVQTYNREVREAAEITYDALTGSVEISDEDLIVNAFRATQYNWFERYRSTYDELVSSGNLSLIKDPELKSTINGFYAIDFIDAVAQEGFTSEYRKAFRKLLPPDLQLALADQCGDREIGDPEDGNVTLDFECVLDWPQEKIGRAASNLRSENDLPPLLAVRIVELHGRDISIQYNREYFGIDAFMQTGIAE